MKGENIQLKARVVEYTEKVKSNTVKDTMNTPMSRHYSEVTTNKEARSIRRKNFVVREEPNKTRTEDTVKKKTKRITSMKELSRDNKGNEYICKIHPAFFRRRMQLPLALDYNTTQMMCRHGDFLGKLREFRLVPNGR